MSGFDGGEAGADVLFDDGGCDFEGDDVLDDDAGGGDGADVGAFVGGGLGGLGRHVNRRPAGRQGADRLLGGADDDRFAVGGPALDAASVVGRASEAESAGVLGGGPPPKGRGHHPPARGAGGGG